MYLKKFRKFLMFLFAGILLNACAEKELKFASGFVGGTYFQVADSLKQLPELQKFLVVESTSGSKENILKIQNGEADIGIAQLDILESMTLANLDLKEKIRAILPLYNEEVHIIAQKSIKKVSDLNGHKVNIGPKNSGSEGTASILFKAFEILDVNVDQAPAAEAIDKLKQGKIDAMILTAGAPVALLESLPASLKKKIHLVPIKKEEFEKLNLGSFHYGSSTIPAKTYPWQPKAVETLVIPSVLLGDKGLSSTSVQKIINAVFKHLDELKEKHPKWKNFSKEYAQGFYQINKDLFHEGAKKVLE